MLPIEETPPPPPPPWAYIMATGLNKWQEAFIKQSHGFQNWLYSYKMDVNFPELHPDLRLFHKKIRGEVLRIIQRLLDPLSTNSQH